MFIGSGPYKWWGLLPAQQPPCPKPGTLGSIPTTAPLASLIPPASCRAALLGILLSHPLSSALTRECSACRAHFPGIWASRLGGMTIRNSCPHLLPHGDSALNRTLGPPTGPALLAAPLRGLPRPYLTPVLIRT